MTLTAAFALAQNAEPEPLPPSAEADVTLPEIQVQTETEPKQKKYPTAAVAKKKPSPGAPAAPSSAPAAAAAAAAPSTAPQPSTTVPEVATTGSLIGDRQGILDLSGSGAVVDGEELYTSHVFTTNEALRKVPGVVVRDEEGMGIRPNIGMRGLNPTRSTKTLLLEDGLFVTFAPYGDNASYFHPSMDRYERVEVIKGADQLLYGPQTISGTINYVTPNPPKKPAGFVAGTVGSNDYYNGQINYGGWIGNFGGLIDYVHKEGDGVRDNMHHEIDDLGLKGVLQVSPTSAFIGKFSYFKEDSQVPYTGLSELEAANFGLRYNPFVNDRFDTERLGASLTHNWDILPILSVATSVYWTSFDRDWWRGSSNTLDTVCGEGIRDARLAGVRIDTDPNDFISGNCVDGRVRSYETYGFEQRATLETQISDGVRNTLKVGYRLHGEEQDRQRIVGVSPFARTGEIRESTARDVEAYSVFAYNRFEVGAFSITPMVRYEDISYDQLNRLSGDRGNTDISEVIPGISVGLEVSRQLQLFAGIHEGFAPPSVADTITGGGQSLDTDPESSVNIEVGFKSEPTRGFILDGTYFRNDFDNLIAAGSVAANVTLSQGEALFEGFELLGRLDSDKLLGTSFNIYGQLAWTWLWTAEQVSAFQEIENPLNPPVFGFDTAGNRQPYAPEHTLTARIGYAQPGVFDIHAEAVYIGEQFADFLNIEDARTSPLLSANQQLSGSFGKIDDEVIVNLGATYTYQPTQTDIFLAVKNVFDEEYIVDRTRGIVPGTERLFHFGIKQDF